MAEKVVRQVKSVPEFNVDSETMSKKEELEEKLLSFVDEQITKIRRYCDLGNGPVGFFELNRALSEFSSINCSLIALDVMVKEEYQKAQDEFDQFVAEKYVETREILNPISLSASKSTHINPIDDRLLSMYSKYLYIIAILLHHPPSKLIHKKTVSQ